MIEIATNSFRPVSSLKWLYLDLNSYFASVEQQENPDLRGQPVAVVPTLSDATCAIAASYEAKAYGIKTGTKIYEAKKKCPHLRCVPARHDLYVAYHHRILQEIEQHLHVSKTCSIDEFACLLLGAEREPENAAILARKIKAGLRANIGAYVTCSIGLAPNILLAKIASDMQKPDGLIVMPPEDLQQRVTKLKLTDLPGIGFSMERRLQRAGISTVQALWNITPKHARRIWGSVEGERFWYRLHGYEIETPESKKSVVGHSRVLDPALRSIPRALDVARQLSLKAAIRLRRYNLYARCFSLSVYTTQRRGWSGDISFSASQDDFTFLRALDTLWARMVSDLGYAHQLLKVSVFLHHLQQPQAVTLDLFEHEKISVLKNAKLSKTIDQMNQRFGKNCISIGPPPRKNLQYLGTKISFTRVPDTTEFECI